jgi:hypothetical protein
MTRSKKTPPVKKIFQIYPPYSREDMEALKLDILKKGLLVDIEVDQLGTIIDGNHRAQAIRELRAEGHKMPDYPRKVRVFKDDDERVAHMVALNERRRHLVADQRPHVVAALRKQGWSSRRIAEELQVSHVTVWRDFKGVTSVTPDLVTGKDGRQYPGTQRPTVRAASTKEEEQVRALIAELGDDLPTRETTVRLLAKRAKKSRIRPSAPPDGSVHKGPRWRLDCVDMREWNVRANSVDLIVTDPPYDRASIPLYRDLSAFATRTLKPGGLLFAYAGLLYLPQIMENLGSELNYVVQMVIVQNARKTPIHCIKVNGLYRPVLVFSKGKYKPERWIDDLIVARTGPEKDRHPWQQSVDPVLQLLERSSDPGDLVCDPFTCTGTTGDAALQLGRRFLGCEIRPDMVVLAKDRLTDVRRKAAT